MGSPRSRSARGCDRGRAEAASDQYSLGCTLFQGYYFAKPEVETFRTEHELPVLAAAALSHLPPPGDGTADVIQIAKGQTEAPNLVAMLADVELVALHGRVVARSLCRHLIGKTRNAPSRSMKPNQRPICISVSYMRVARRK